MKRFIVFVLAMFISCAVFAQNEQMASRASVEELLELMGTKQSYDAAMLDTTKMAELSTERFLDQIPVQNHARFKQVMALLNTLYQEEMGWEKTKPHFVRIYTETYTQQEVNDLIAFYKTPSGQAFIRKNPLVEQKIAMIYQKNSMEIIDRLAKIVKETQENP